jgi:23S rRNA pseudouridine1911/1915/1917 synthase
MKTESNTTRGLTPTLHHVKASTQYKREHKADYGHERIEVLYEDKDIVVINKPSGMLSVPYPGSRSRTALDVLENIMRKNGTWTSSHHPFIVHRLDRDTSGVMMFALSEPVQKKIMHTWHTMVTERLYHAVAENPHYKEGKLPDSGIIDDPLAKNAHNVGYVPKDNDSSVDTVAARTHYKVLVRGKTHTLFELSLDTGKKNQIRAHLASKGYPLAGDENYRARTDPFGRLALHARTLDFVHPTTGKKMHFEVPEPEEWMTYVEHGDNAPDTPIWRKHTVHEANDVSVPVPHAARPSRRDVAHMGFIGAAKSRNK